MLLLVLRWDLLLLAADPRLKLFDGCALHGKLDVGVDRVNFAAWGMAHQRHADFLQDAGLHQAGVEGVAKIVKTHVAKTCFFKRGLPRALHDADCIILVADDESFGSAMREQVAV